MSSDEAVEWIAENMPRSFKSYRDLRDFDEGIKRVKAHNAAIGKDGRKDSMDSFIDGWVSGKYKPKTSIDDVKAWIEPKKIEDMMKLGFEDAKKELDDMKNLGEYSSDTIKMVEDIVSGFTDRVWGEIDRLWDKEDIPGMRAIKTLTSEQEELKQNQLNNLALTKARKYRADKDIASLESLKGDISGLRDESEISTEIDNFIKRLEKETEKL